MKVNIYICEIYNAHIHGGTWKVIHVWFQLAFLYCAFSDLLKKLAPLSQPIISKTIKNRNFCDACIFPRLMLLQVLIGLLLMFACCLFESSCF